MRSFYQGQWQAAEGQRQGQNGGEGGGERTHQVCRRRRRVLRPSRSRRRERIRRNAGHSPSVKSRRHSLKSHQKRRKYTKSIKAMNKRKTAAFDPCFAENKCNLFEDGPLMSSQLVNNVSRPSPLLAQRQPATSANESTPSLSPFRSRNLKFAT